MIIVKYKKWFNVVGITVWPFIFLRKDFADDKTTITHESIHVKQQGELLLILFYLWYVIEWMIKGFSYNKISFEKEAYANENNENYLNTRKHYSFLKYF